MSFTKDQFMAAGMDVTDELTANVAVEWLLENTTFDIDLNNFDTVDNLPNSAKLFVVKFSEITYQNNLVVSESIAGMSQSFKTDSTNTLIWDLAYQLISKYLKSNINILPNKSKWY